MTDAPDIVVELADTETVDLEDAIGASCSGTTLWSRDGILEHQVSTQEEIQLCFRNEPAGERPRAGICLAGDDETLTVAAIVPIDRGVELSDAQREAIVTDFYEAILSPALENLEADARLT